MADPATTSGRRSAVFLLGVVAAMGSLATQLLVPALPTLARDLGAGMADAQLVIGVFLLSLGAGQLVCGPLADRLGRKPVLLAGLALFVAASLAASMTANLPAMLFARAVQAMGAAAGIVTARVMLGDLFPPKEVAGAQASLMAVILVSPVIAPVVGGQLTELIGWRGLMMGLSSAGLLSIALATWRLPNLRSPTRHDQPSVLSAYRELLANRAFLSGTAALAAGSAALYMFLGYAPFLLQREHGFGPGETGLCLTMVAVASMIGTRLVRPIEQRGSALLAGSMLALAGALSLSAAALSGMVHIATFVIPMLLLGAGAGLTGPAAITRVLLSRRGLAGTTTSLAGAIQTACSAAAAYALGHAAPVSTGALASALVPATLAGLTATLISLRLSRP